MRVETIVLIATAALAAPRPLHDTNTQALPNLPALCETETNPTIIPNPNLNTSPKSDISNKEAESYTQTYDLRPRCLDSEPDCGTPKTGCVVL